MTRSVSSSAATLASDSPSPAVVMAAATTEAAAAAAAAATSTSTNRRTLRTRVCPSNNKWGLTPISLLIRTLEYMDNDTLVIMCLVCKQIKELIWSGQGMENKLVRIFELYPSKDNYDHGQLRVRRFVSNMNQYFQNGTKTRILQGFQHWKVQGVEKFVDNSYAHVINNEELERLTQNVRMPGIVSLDMSLPLSIAQPDHSTLYRAILFMVPNLQEVDLSNTSASIRENFAGRCPRLEIIRWNNNGNYSIDASGSELRSMNNLKELYFDNWCFFFSDIQDHRVDDNGDTDDDDDDDDDDDNDNVVTDIEAMLDNDNYPNVFFFSLLCHNPLERISLRNAQYVDSDLDSNLNYVLKIIPQSILMKFVRKAPATLVWFRSDLSPANIRILQSERPGIQFLN